MEKVWFAVTVAAFIALIATVVVWDREQRVHNRGWIALAVMALVCVFAFYSATQWVKYRALNDIESKSVPR